MSRYGVISLMVLLGGVLLSAQDFQVQTRVDLVVVPVSVRDGDRIVGGLTKDDFAVFEDGRPQEISNFSADPQPLSAAIVIDTGMGGTARGECATRSSPPPRPSPLPCAAWPPQRLLP
jgi:hypothetical protein